MNQYIQELTVWATEGILALVVLGLVRLWLAHFKLREEIARDYVKKSDLGEHMASLDTRVERLQERFEKDMADVRTSSARILELVAEIRGRTNAASYGNG